MTESELILLSNKTLLTPLTSANVNSLAYNNGFSNLKHVEPSLGVPSYTNLTSAYYFSTIAISPDYGKSRKFTGHDSLFLSGSNLSYAHNNPSFNLDVSGNFRALSAYIPLLSTNYIGGETLSIQGFSSVQIDSNVYANRTIANYISADEVYVTNLKTLSSVFDYYNVSPDLANLIFSNITWNVTAGGDVSAKNIFIKEKLLTPFISSNNSFFNNVTADYIENCIQLSSLSSLYVNNIYGSLQIDSKSPLQYNNNVLSTTLSASYYFGVKPSEPYSTDDISIMRTLNGAHYVFDDIATATDYPVLKPFFKNIKQIFDYVEKYGLYGDSLNILIYEDIIQNNVNPIGGSQAGCEFEGNIKVAYYNENSLPSFMSDAGFKSGDYVWNNTTRTDINGSISYLKIPKLNFENLNIFGVYPIYFTDHELIISPNKPFNTPPHKITFRTYVCSNPTLPFTTFGNTPTDWNALLTLSSNNVFNRQIVFDNGDMDVNLKNLCFEFDCNNNDSTGLYFKSGVSYISNVTVALLGAANYAYGALTAEYGSNVYICGTPQVDPILEWSIIEYQSLGFNIWSDINSSGVDYLTEPIYFPGYGLAIVGNQSADTPTLFSGGFINAWRSNIFIMDYNTNRNVGRNSYLNSSIILDGKFSANSFYQLKDHSKIYTTNYIFKAANLEIHNYNANIFDNSSYNGKYKNVFLNTNRDNFYYVNFIESYSTFSPHYFEMTPWVFSYKDPLTHINSDNNQITIDFGIENEKYKFNETTSTINLSGMVFGNYQNNILHEASPLNDEQCIYDYIAPSDLLNYNTNGFYKLNTPLAQYFGYGTLVNSFDEEGNIIGSVFTPYDDPFDLSYYN
jgi:hypothetical protein